MEKRQEFLEELRSIVSSDSWPTSIENWKHCRDTNCLAFALGLDIADPEYHNFFGRLSNFSDSEEKFVGEQISSDVITEVFLKICQTIGLQCRPIDSPNDATSTEYVIAFFGIYPDLDIYRSTLSKNVYNYDFHLVRRNLDGTWVHKPGWGFDQKPERAEWKYLQLEYPGHPHYFAIWKNN